MLSGRRFRLFLVFPALAATGLATTSTTVTWSGTLTSPPFSSGGSIIFSGSTTMAPLGTGTMSASILTSTITYDIVPIPFSITFNSGATLSGSIALSTTAFEGGGSVAGSATVTSGTAEYSGYSGTFPVFSTSNSGFPSSGLSMTFSATGTLTMGGAPPPTISAVLDAGSYTPGVAPGSIFVVKGSGLSNPGLFDEAYPLPATSVNPSAGGVSITLTPQGFGPAITAYLIYEYNQAGVNQLAAVLPSTPIPGNYDVTVTSNGMTSAVFQVTVFFNKPELLTGDATGNGLALIQNYVSTTELDVNRFTTGTVRGSPISPAHPGQTLILYATGLGPITTPDNQPAPVANSFGLNVRVILGGQSLPVAYAGRTPGDSGLDQINVTLPAGVATGCAISLQISEEGSVSQSIFLSIAPVGSESCVYPGYTAVQLQNFDNGAVVYQGAFAAGEVSTTLPQIPTNYLAGGAFVEYTGFELPAIPASSLSGILEPTCTVTQVPAGQPSAVSAAGIVLDAGAITLNGPSGSGAANEALLETSIGYAANITGLPAGTWTLTGKGGSGVGPFSATLTTGAPLTITGGLPASINRSAGFTVHWSGGNAADTVLLSGFTGTFAQGVVTGQVAFSCLTTAGAGSLTVPASITSQLLAVSTANPAAGSGQLMFSSGASATFNAPLVGGGSISNSVFASNVLFSGPATFQ